MNDSRVYQKPHTVVSQPVSGTETDFTDRLQLASLFLRMQDAAALDADRLNLGAARLDAQGCCWLLARLSVQLERLPGLQELLSVETWSRGAPRLMFNRDFRFWLGEPAAGRLLGQGTTEWFVARKDTHRPVRPTEIVAPEHLAEALQAEAVSGVSLVRLPLLAEDEEAETAWPPYVKRADYSDIDRNRHVNNTRYIAWCMDAVHRLIPELQGLDAENLAVRQIDIQFMREVRYGETLEIRSVPQRAAPDWHLQLSGRIREQDCESFRARLVLGRSSA